MRYLCVVYIIIIQLYTEKSNFKIAKPEGVGRNRVSRQTKVRNILARHESLTAA